MATIDLDARELAREIVVRVTHIGEFTWRARVALWLLKLAQAIAPFQIEMFEHIGEPCLLYCPYCGLEFATYIILERETDTKLCLHCGRQCFIVGDGGEAKVVRHPEPCDFGCGFTEPYGFVPEAGCPIHDKEGD